MNNNYLKYNNLGILVDSSLGEVSQGNNNVDYYFIAYDVYDYTNSSVTVSVTLPDGTQLPELATSPKDFEFKESQYKGFMFKLSETLTYVSGILTITFNLKSAENNTQLCSSQLNIEIHETDVSLQPTITEEQYNQMQETIRENHAELSSKYESTLESIYNKIEEEGLKGEPGKAATIKLGGVATGKEGTDVVITNTGTPNDAVFNFIIPRGSKGDKGDRGETGPQGIQGKQGEQGVAGPTGPKGDKGDKGESGTSFVISGEVNNISDLPTLNAEDIGTAYFVGVTIPKDVYLWGYSNRSLQWINQGPLQGPQGERGPIGETGPIGPTGPQGIQGEEGPRGPKGDTGEVPDDYVRCKEATASPKPDIDPFDHYYKKVEIDSKLSSFPTKEYVDEGLNLKKDEFEVLFDSNTVSNAPYIGESEKTINLGKNINIGDILLICIGHRVIQTRVSAFDTFRTEKLIAAESMDSLDMVSVLIQHKQTVNSITLSQASKKTVMFTQQGQELTAEFRITKGYDLGQLSRVLRIYKEVK